MLSSQGMSNSLQQHSFQQQFCENRELKQTDAVAVNRQISFKFRVMVVKGRLNSLGLESLWIEICRLAAAPSVCLSSLIPECPSAANSEHLCNAWLMPPMWNWRWRNIPSLMNHFVKDFISLKIDHMQSFQLVFFKCFNIVANHFVHMYCGNQYPENWQNSGSRNNLTLLKFYLGQFVSDLSKLGLII